MPFITHKDKLFIIVPPIILLIIGFGVYIAVVKMTTNEEQVVTVTSDPPSNKDASSSAALVETTPVKTVISLDITAPTSEQLATWQDKVDNGEDLWRLDPLKVAEQTAGQYGFLVNDQLTIVQPGEGESLTQQAVILARSGGVNYEIVLEQPVIKGEKGIWVIVDINEA